MASAAEADTVSEATNPGTEILSFSTLTTNVVLNLGSSAFQTVHANRTLKLNATNTFENALGGSGNETLTGNDGDNILSGLAGNDIMEGGGGRDILIGGWGLDTLNGGTGDHRLVGDLTGSSFFVWTHQAGTPYVPSPTVSGHRLYFAGGNNDILTVLDLETGKPLIEKQRLGIGNTYASPLAVNGRIYFVGREGTTVVISDDASEEVLSRNVINDTFDASPVAISKQLLLRS